MPQHGIGSAPLILLNPNASDLLPLRRWPAPRYVELARRLLERYPELFIGFTGAPAEAAANNQLAAEAGSRRVIQLAGKTTLRQLLVLYTRSDILVTNDSGPAHFASMTPIRVLTLFGPETPALFAAQSPNATALWASIACSPCVNAYNNRQSICRNNLCMTSDYEILIVNDASTDRSAEIAEALAGSNPFVKVFHHERNLKLGGALRTGFSNATKELVFYCDSDLPVDLTELNRAVRIMSPKSNSCTTTRGDE